TTRSVRGFFDLSRRSELAALARQQAPGDVGRAIAEADALLGTGVDLLGRRFRPADPAFDWHADPDRGRLRAPPARDDGDAVRGVRADVKQVWEVNRHQFVVTLARAFRYTDDARYAAAAIDIVRRWIGANPCGVGVNWASNLEVALRALSWAWAIQLL